MGKEKKRKNGERGKEWRGRDTQLGKKEEWGKRKRGTIEKEREEEWGKRERDNGERGRMGRERHILRVSLSLSPGVQWLSQTEVKSALLSPDLSLSRLQTCQQGGQKERNLILTTKYGQLQGKTVTVKETDQAVHAFLGIPFAKPPVGPLRFAPPQKAEPWSSIRDATQQPNVCLQDPVMLQEFKEAFKAMVKIPPISEDCLYLNVFTPENHEKNSKLPVMAFIHGGSLTMGGVNFYDGSSLSANENVVMVAIQYRLGVMGFLSTGDEEAPGNYGFLDQTAALQWVQENIEDFGGDPQSVTIFGESAGGVLSPLSKGLFHRAISESGVALTSGLMITKAEDTIGLRNFIANISGCDSQDTKEILECLKKKSEEEVLALTSHPKLAVIPACVDGFFLPKAPEEIQAAKESNRVPYIIGVTNQEFGWSMLGSMNLTTLEKGMDKNTMLSILQNFPLFNLNSDLIPLIIDEYFGDTDDPVEIRDRLMDLGSDIIFVIPSIKTARYHRDSGLPVYFYEFQHQPSMFKESRPAFIKADHADDLIFVFGGPFFADDLMFSGPATDEEKVFSRTVMRYWANFARSGNPNGPGLVEWPEYGEEEDYLEINLKPKSAKKFNKQRADFWTIRLPEKIQEMQSGNGDRTEL